MLSGGRAQPGRGDLIAAGVLMACALVVLAFEPAWTSHMMIGVNWAASRIDTFVKTGGQFGATFGIVLVGFLILALDRDNRRRLFEYVTGVLMLAVVNTSLKALFHRQRPMFDRRNDYVPEAPMEEIGRWLGPWPGSWKEFIAADNLSFPSGHSAMAAFMAAFLTARYPRGAAIWWTLAVLCAIYRVDNARHYVSDCLAGFAVGIFVHWLHAKWLARRAGSNHPAATAHA